MRLQSLKNNRDRSAVLIDLVEDLIRNKNIQSTSHFDSYDSIELIPLKDEIKHQNWAIGVSLSGYSKSGERISGTFFVKQTPEIAFQKELKGVEELKKTIGKKGDFRSKISIPIEFVTQHRLIISQFCDGQNVKMAIRNCYVKPWSRKIKKKMLDQCKIYGAWLAMFHKATRQTISNLPTFNKNSVSKGVDEIIYPAQVEIVQGCANKIMLQEVRSRLEKNMYYCCVHGDYGPQNIVQKNGDFNILDWERCHLGYNIEDCVHFIMNVLTQVRHVPYDFGFTRRYIDHFLKGYYDCHEPQSHLPSQLAILLGVNTTLKTTNTTISREEWPIVPSALYRKVTYVSLLFRIAEQAYSKIVK